MNPRKYHIVLLKNGEWRRSYNRLRTREWIFKSYHKILKENENVLFPQRYVNHFGIIPVKYHLCVLKRREEGDENITLRDEYGRLKEEPPIISPKPYYNEYTVLDKNPFELEETFWVYGYDSVYERKTISDIVYFLTEGLKDSKDTIRSVMAVYNKLLIYDEEKFHMVICKCQKDAQRLHHALRDAAFENKLNKKIVFLGTAAPQVASEMYEFIHEKTGWAMDKIRRTTTRP